MKKFVVVFFILIIFFGVYLLFLKKIPNLDIKKINISNMIKIDSSAFPQGGAIPLKYTCKGADVNPPLKIQNIPQGTKSLVIIVDDPDAPMGTWTHWLVWNISPDIKEIAENSVPEGAVLGVNDFGLTQYRGPCPPSGTHRYFFRIFALSKLLELNEGASQEEVKRAMENYILDKGELMGIFSN